MYMLQKINSEINTYQSKAANKEHMEFGSVIASGNVRYHI